MKTHSTRDRAIRAERPITRSAGRAAIAVFATLGALVTFGSTASADVPPPEGYVETCTAGRQANASRTCVACASYHANPRDHCATQVGAGYTRACRSRGASTWTEVWCRPTEGGAAAPPTPTSDPAVAPGPSTPAATRVPEAEAEDCSTAPAGSAALASTFALVGWVVTRRRARRGIG